MQTTKQLAGLFLMMALAMGELALAQRLPNFSDLIETYGAAVVNVRASRTTQTETPELDDAIPEPFRRFFEEPPGGRGRGEGRGQGRSPRRFDPRAQGSGFIINANGLILTNAHVVEGAEEIVVILADRRELPAKLLGADERTDVALLKVEAGDLPQVKVGDSDKLRVGDWVLAIGSPFGFERSATQGIVSALSRSLPDGTYVPFIQTDAAVNPGNSGGPLFSLDGTVVGINAQIYTRSGGYQGLSFAIPINVAMNVAKQLETSGRVQRGWLGVGIQDMDQQLAESFKLPRPQGALVTQVNPGSPAEKAGILDGDVILTFNKQPIERSSSLPPVVGATPIDSTVEVEVMRDGKRRTLKLTVGELAEAGRPIAQSSIAPENNADLGMTLGELTPELRKQLQIDRGVVVRELAIDGPAAEAGLQPNDVILSFNREPVENARQLQELAGKVDKGKRVLVQVRRGDNTFFVTFPLG